ncbi:hypothetical protein COU77_00400 [Candidatus Peregrinibacteria bacterium CG10_big_fil_rev_8_21_14_0_10_49_16]|nr:MAG: hypothetical protein COW95_00415 [Candidatus Peregrinibacteria bacterium CG22_combo_CG10-13_8_21_14_all_49_11]PIR52406.1 MAG: hypothetical protein COU77_00400 [Candidatus Peregrinibacteria bacterium CG10_big_fil_rev_8_21_14_0_10_49_16]
MNVPFVLSVAVTGGALLVLGLLCIGFARLSYSPGFGFFGAMMVIGGIWFLICAAMFYTSPNWWPDGTVKYYGG